MVAMMYGTLHLNVLVSIDFDDIDDKLCLSSQLPACTTHTDTAGWL